MDNILITYIKNLNLKKKNYIFFGKKNAETYLKILKSKNKIIDIEKIFKIEDKLEKNFIYCEHVYNKILNQLSKKLNKIHGTVYQSYIWKLILGRWLQEFIYLSFLNFTTLSKLFYSKKINNIISLKPEKYELIANDYLDFVNSYNNSKWISKFNCFLIHYLQSKKNCKIQYLRDQEEKKTHNIKTSLYYYLKKFLFLIFFRYFSKYNNILFYKSGLNFYVEKKIESRLNQFFSFFEFSKFNYSKKINFKKRQYLKLKLSNKNTFEIFLQNNLKYFFPKYLVEDFQEIKKFIDQSYLPKKTKLIFTATGFVDSIFNVYSAEQVLKGSKLAIVQHGNGYNTHFVNNYLYEFNTPTYFLTWGKKFKKNQISLFNINVKKVLKKKNYIKNLSIICESFSYRIVPYHPFYVKEKNFLKTLQFVSKLKHQIKKNTFFKLRWSNDKELTELNNLFKKKIIDLNLNVYKSDFKYSKILNSSKLMIFNYDSTGFYENLINGSPSICYIKNLRQFTSNEYINDYYELKKCKLIFDDESKLIKHVHEIWNNPNDWWNSKEVKKIINKFNFKYNKINYNKEEIISNKLKKLI